MGLLFYFASSILCLTSITADKAQWLVQYNNNDKKFELNDDALSRLSQLSEPVKVISAVGEARVGKSTSLNILHNIWQGDKKQQESIKEVFKSGDSFEPVTHGIWISVLDKDNESIVLLDVEGTNLGNSAVTSHLGVFSCLMSSGILIFLPETVKNDILDHLYEVVRLSEHIFKSVDDNHNFGHLHVVIRGALRMPAGMTLEESVRNSIVQPSGQDEGTDSKRQAIAKYFRKHSITASEIPFVPDRDPLKKFETKNNVYWEALKSLAGLVKINFSPKTTLRGIMVDGNALVQTAKVLTDMMNKNSWMDFSNTYLMVEKYLCDKRFKKVVEPALEINTVSKLETENETVLNDFRDGCALGDEVVKAEKQIKTLWSRMREMDDKDQYVKATEKEMRRAIKVLEEAEGKAKNDSDLLRKEENELKIKNCKMELELTKKILQKETEEREKVEKENKSLRKTNKLDLLMALILGVVLRRLEAVDAEYVFRRLVRTI